jgi:hypothetical protein
VLSDENNEGRLTAGDTMLELGKEGVKKGLVLKKI